MIIIDFSCDTGHRFSGYFMNHEAYREQLEKKNISCPLCDSREVRRAYTGCSIRVKSSSPSDRGGEALPLFQAIRQFNRFVREHFENVGREFPDVARAIHYGIETERAVYGEASLDEIKELGEDGIAVLPLPDVDRYEH